MGEQLLSAWQERELVIAAEHGDDSARHKLVDACLPAIIGLARGFQGSRVEGRELIQEGVVGLLSAARRYDSTLETPFWAYARFWVRKGMQELVADLTRPVALSDRATRELARLRSARDEHLQSRGSEPTTAQLGAATGLGSAHVESLLATDRMPRCIDSATVADGRTGASLADTVVDPRAELAYETVLDDLEIDEALKLTSRLEERERTVIRGHYGLGQQPRTLREVGANLGLTAERVRQIEVAALAKLRQELAGPPLSVDALQSRDEALAGDRETDRLVEPKCGV